MASLDYNIVDQEQLLLSVETSTIIENISACNTSAGSITLSFFKLLAGSGETRFYLINSIALGVKETFIFESIRLESGGKLYVGVSGGSISLTLDYL